MEIENGILHFTHVETKLMHAAMNIVAMQFTREVNHQMLNQPLDKKAVESIIELQRYADKSIANSRKLLKDNATDFTRVYMAFRELLREGEKDNG